MLYFVTSFVREVRNCVGSLHRGLRQRFIISRARFIRDLSYRGFVILGPRYIRDSLHWRFVTLEIRHIGGLIWRGLVGWGGGGGSLFGDCYIRELTVMEGLWYIEDL